jgi:hypothetical protein
MTQIVTPSSARLIRTHHAHIDPLSSRSPIPLEVSMSETTNTICPEELDAYRRWQEARLNRQTELDRAVQRMLALMRRFTAMVCAS